MVKYMGMDFINNTWTTRWEEEMSSWFTLYPDNKPFKFSFPPNQFGRTDMYTIYYNLTTYKEMNFNSSIFEKPSYCKEKCTWKPPGPKRIFSSKSIYLD